MPVRHQQHCTFRAPESDRSQPRQRIKKINKIKSRDSTLPTKVHTVKAMIFPIVMYKWESWT